MGPSLFFYSIILPTAQDEYYYFKRQDIRPRIQSLAIGPGADLQRARHP
jgi:hypothetical protein